MLLPLILLVVLSLVEQVLIGILGQFVATYFQEIEVVHELDIGGLWFFLHRNQ